jgi:hypothetical protein
MIGRRTVDVACMVQIEQTPESFHAHAIPCGIDIRPGDRVRVHGAPAHIGFGDRISLQCRATVTRAPWFHRIWTQAIAPFALTELYEVGFAPKELS